MAMPCVWRARGWVLVREPTHERMSHVAGALLIALAASTQQCTQQECGCGARSARLAMWQSNKAVRKISNGAEMGSLDNALLDEAQQSLASATDAIRKLHAACSVAVAGGERCVNGTTYSGLEPLLLRKRSSRCRLPRLLNISHSAQRRLDDAATGVLFGDSSENVLALAAALPAVLHGTSRAASEMERHGRRCASLVEE